MSPVRPAVILLQILASCAVVRQRLCLY